MGSNAKYSPIVEVRFQAATARAIPRAKEAERGRFSDEPISSAASRLSAGRCEEACHVCQRISFILLHRVDPHFKTYDFHEGGLLRGQTPSL
jgi:hypothetical protein